jgi:hypothetical protein
MERNIWQKTQDALAERTLDRQTDQAERRLYLDRSSDPLSIGRMFLRNAISTYKISPEQAASLLWCVVNGKDDNGKDSVGSDGYQIDRSGKIKRRVLNELDGQEYWVDVDKYDWNVGSDRVRLKENFGTQTTNSSMVTLTSTSSERTLYLVAKDKGILHLEKSIQLLK